MSARTYLLVALFASTLGCAGSDHVVRVIDGRPVAGDFVPAEAYAAYLRASIADAAGDLAGAIEGYAIASALGPRDPEPLARLGDARCRMDPRDPRAEEALERALAVDAEYAPALAARATCAERRGDARLAIESARRAAKADPAALEPLATLARLQPPGPSAASEELRARLVAMTLASGTNAAAWSALATWARGHGDAQLEARALAQVATLGVSRQVPEDEIPKAIFRFEGEGEIGAARELARVRVETGAARPIDARIARLAIDQALLSGDTLAARRIATRSRLPSLAVAARAFLYGDVAGAIEIASPLSEAEPNAVAPRLILAAAAEARRDGPILARALAAGANAKQNENGPLLPEVWLAYARALARAGGGEGARAFLLAMTREPLLPGDTLTTPIAVALAAAGALEAKELDPNGRVELAERRAETVADDVIAGADDRHRLLAFARRAPRDSRTLALARALSPQRTRDPVVAVAFARLALVGAVDTPSMSDVLARLDPADPLVAGAALDCALRAGDTRAIPLARARLAAVAHTPAERARAVE